MKKIGEWLDKQWEDLCKSEILLIDDVSIELLEEKDEIIKTVYKQQNTKKKKHNLNPSDFKGSSQSAGNNLQVKQ